MCVPDAENEVAVVLAGISTSTSFSTVGSYAESPSPRAMIMSCTSDVPSPISSTLESR